MPYELYIERRAEKDLKKLETALFSEIVAKIKGLADNPHPQGCKKIAGSHNDWRIRIGNKTKTIKIMRVKHRREVYRGL